MKKVLATAVFACSLVVSIWFFALYGKGSYPFFGDSMGYYMYLPTTFIYHNHKALDWLPHDKGIRKPIFNIVAAMSKDAVRTPKGYIINKYTYGVAALELPFFFIAHGYERLTGGDANGYSGTYIVLLQIGTLFYACLGLMLLYLILRQFYDKPISLMTISVILVGTNFFWFALLQSSMAHIPVFFLYTLLIYGTMRLHRQPQLRWFVIAALSAGMITVIRPTDIICLLIPLLYNVYSLQDAKEKVAFLKNNIRKIGFFIVAFVLPIIPQMLYWKKFAGSFFYYSYAGEGFNWTHPKIIDGMFGFANGWLIYTPVMVFALVGLLFVRNYRSLTLPLFIILPVYIYITYSWHCYNYINGLGSRPMIHLYPLLAIAFAALLQYIVSSNAGVKVIAGTLILLCVGVNVSYSIQQAKGILVSEESNRVYTIHMLFKTHASYNDLVTYDVQQVQPRESQLQRIATIACNDYDDSLSTHFIRDNNSGHGMAYHMAADEEYHPYAIEVKYDTGLFKGAQWIKCSGNFECTQQYLYFKHLLVLDILNKESTKYWYGCKIDNKIGLIGDTLPTVEYTLDHLLLNKWSQVSFFVRVPSDLKTGDRLRLYVWNIGKQELLFDNVCLSIYK